MKNSPWMTAKEACAALHVRPQSLYAYVSRGLLTAMKDPEDARRSLYDPQRVAALAAQHSRPRARRDVASAAIDWGDPVLVTSVSGLRDGELWFGSRPACACADKMTLEEVAAHHWGRSFKACNISDVLPSGPALTAGAGFLAIHVGREGEGEPTAEALVLGLVQAMTGAAVQRAVHVHLAQVWKAPAAGDDIRRALVLLSDHELNPSTFAVRVCASTEADMAACLLAGLATLSGPLHGGVASKTARALAAAEQGDAALEDFLAQAGDPFTFGLSHPLYPLGDPRAAHVMGRWSEDCPVLRAAHRLAQVCGAAPNIDLALAVLTRRHRLPPEAPFVIFALARMVGWIAHVAEQRASGAMIRPRAQFESGS